MPDVSFAEGKGAAVDKTGAVLQDKPVWEMKIENEKNDGDTDAGSGSGSIPSGDYVDIL